MHVQPTPSTDGRCYRSIMSCCSTKPSISNVCPHPRQPQPCTSNDNKMETTYSCVTKMSGERIVSNMFLVFFCFIARQYNTRYRSTLWGNYQSHSCHWFSRLNGSPKLDPSSDTLVTEMIVETEIIRPPLTETKMKRELLKTDSSCIADGSSKNPLTHSLGCLLATLMHSTTLASLSMLFCLLLSFLFHTPALPLLNAWMNVCLSGK